MKPNDWKRLLRKGNKANVVETTIMVLRPYVLDQLTLWLYRLRFWAI